MAKSNGRKMKVVGISWRDASIHTAWTEKPGAKQMTPVISAGLLADEDHEVVRLAVSYTQDGDWGDIMVIPKSQIVRRKVFAQIEVE